MHRNPSQAQTQRVADATVEAFTAAVFGRLLDTDADHGNDPRVQGTPEFAKLQYFRESLAHTHITSYHIMPYSYIMLYFYCLIFIIHIHT